MLMFYFTREASLHESSKRMFRKLSSHKSNSQIKSICHVLYTPYTPEAKYYLRFALQEFLLI